MSQPKKEYTKNSLIRLAKLGHFLLSIVVFALCWKVFYLDIASRGFAAMSILVVIAIYAAILLLLLRTYNGYHLGLNKKTILVYSQTLSNLIAAGIFYVLLTIDQVKLLNPLPLIGLLVVQFLFNIVWTILARNLYFMGNRAKKTILIYRKAADKVRLNEVFLHEKEFRVVKELKVSGEDIYDLMQEMEGYEAVFVAGVPATLRNGILKHCIDNKIVAYIAPHVGDVIMMGAKHVELFSAPIVCAYRADPKIEYVFIKRVFDIVASLLGIIVLSPFMIGTALAVKLYDGGPALYKQVRLTKDGKHFEIMKFRSMGVNAESDGVARLATENDNRITPVGKVIRACRLDELPQLFNILKGDMTIVGPRPERPEIAAQYVEHIPAFSLRLQVKAGLTGYAQVYGKYNTDPYDKLQMDLMYINRMSVAEDLKLMFATVKILFMKESTEGIADGSVTANDKAAETAEDRELVAP